MPKYVKLMPDYCSNGLWLQDGTNMDEISLPVSQDLLVKILSWATEYSKNDLSYLDADDERRKNSKFDVEKYSVEGLLIARMIKQQLPDWTIEYFDEARSYVSDSRADYVYEIKNELSSPFPEMGRPWSPQMRQELATKLESFKQYPQVEKDSTLTQRQGD